MNGKNVDDKNLRNADERTIAGFGHQWATYRQDREEEEMLRLFERYFSLFPWERVGPDAVGFDMGCGSGRWAKFVAERVGKLLCVDASAEAIEVARDNLKGKDNVEFVVGSVGDDLMPEGSMDFGYSLGVLHHVPDTRAALAACVKLLKPGAPFLVYLYYSMDNKPGWYRAVWKVSGLLRWTISRLPIGLRNVVTEAIALTVYWPLARLARVLDRFGLDVKNLPLNDYKDSSFYRMRHNARDRFGTPLEQRFSRKEIEEMMTNAGAERIAFREGPPYWCALGFRKA